MRGDGKRTELLPAWVDVQCDGDVDWGSKGQVCATMSVVLAHTRRSLDTCNRWEHSDSLQATPTLREQASGLSAHAWISASKFVPPPKPWARVGALLSEEAHVEAVTRESQTAAATKQDTPGPARNSSCPPDHGPRPPSHALSRTPSCICNRASTQVTGSLCRTATATTPRPSHAFSLTKSSTRDSSVPGGMTELNGHVDGAITMRSFLLQGRHRIPTRRRLRAS